MSLQSFYLFSLALGLVAYLGLTVFCAITWARRITGRAAFTAALMSLLFLSALALTGVGPVSLSLEVLALLAWMGLLIRVIGVDRGNVRDPALRPVMSVFMAALGLGLVVVACAWALPFAVDAGLGSSIAALFAAQLLLAICGLVLLEQVIRNTRDDLRWRLRYLNIGIGTLFAFQLLHAASALLFNAYLPALVAVQPAVFALATPFIAIASVRNPTNPLRLNLSRRFVFRSGVLVITGVLLLVMGLFGYLLQALEGNWVAALLTLLLFSTAVGLVTVFGSMQVRLRARRWIEEHLFASKYDYREEWRRVTQQLTEPSPDYDLPQQVLRAMGRVLRSGGGAVWRLTPQGTLVPLSQLHTSWTDPLSPATTQRLREFFEVRDWVLDLHDLPDSARPAMADAGELAGLSGVRFVVPLMTEARLSGIAALNDPPVDVDLTWEDYDVLKLIARQAAGFIALREAERELADADKLNSFNQVSAFIVHDVKTISAQLSLLLENAARHKANPAFVDDMIATVGNAVARMNKLLAQLREDNGESRDTVELADELRETLCSFTRQAPAPNLDAGDGPARVAADSTKLRSALGHLLQNAIDAANLQAERSGDAPQVSVSLRCRGAWAEVAIQDTGPGMESAFIDKVLFQPFASTKGVAGMGVGAYQARAYIRSLGGDVTVTSRPGTGSTFTVKLPLEPSS